MYALLLPPGKKGLKIVAIYLVPWGFLKFKRACIQWLESCFAHILVWIIGQLRIIYTRIDNYQFVWYCFMYDHKYQNAQSEIKFCSSFKLFQSCPLLKVAHAYQNFLEQNLKALSYRSLEQFGVPYVKQGEELCYFNCNIFILVEQSYHGIVGRPFGVALFPMVPMYVVLQQKKIFGHTWSFQEWAGVLKRKRHFDVLSHKLGMDVAPKYLAIVRPLITKNCAPNTGYFA